MTRDAKIGLLLGLVFIFVIAFIINGLPGSGRRENSNELTANLVGPQSGSPGLAVRERRVPLALNEPGPRRSQSAEPARPYIAEQHTRFSMALPQVPPGLDEQPQTGGSAAKRLAEAAKQVAAEAPPKQVLPRFYVVQNGDMLSTIAVKLYGPEQGNKLANVKGIFEANRGTLGSLDEIYVGQKLIIPPLAGAPRGGETARAIHGPDFVEVKGIGERHTAKGKSQPRQNKVCVVRDGDSLWQIAAKRLGDGSRYKEIAKLNRDVIKDEDELMTGMRLRLPAR